jgi:hypothetical protein
MNVVITTYVRFGGPLDGLEPLLAGITDAIIANGYANSAKTDVLTALVAVEESDLGSYENINDYVKTIFEKSLAVYIPMDGEEIDNANGSRN